MKGAELMNAVWFCIGIVVGAILYTILISIFVVAGRADHANTSGGKMSEERRNELVERLWDIMDEFELNDSEIASILHQGDIYNEKTAAASNRIAQLILEEDLTVDEGVELFDYCYNSLG